MDPPLIKFVDIISCQMSDVSNHIINTNVHHTRTIRSVNFVITRYFRKDWFVTYARKAHECIVCLYLSSKKFCY